MKNPLVYAVPLFGVLMLIEWLVTRRRRPDAYSFEDTLSNLSTGMLLLIVDAVARVFTFGFYVYLYEHVRVATFAASSVWTWILFFFGTDLCYYVFHALAHKLPFLWPVHAPHHQSERFNYSVALRQGAFQYTVDSFFYLPLAVLGCPPAVFLLQLGFLKLYQFWLHTELVGRIPWLEGILSTPSSHRVHHARNAPYVDKNMGGTLALWDRLFGTWEPENPAVPVAYGVDPPLRVANPLIANVRDMWQLVSRQREASPGDVSRSVQALSSENLQVSNGKLRAYLVLNFALCAALVVLAMLGKLDSSHARGWALLFAALGLITATGLLDDARRFRWLDAARWVFGAVVLGFVLYP